MSLLRDFARSAYSLCFIFRCPGKVRKRTSRTASKAWDALDLITERRATYNSLPRTREIRGERELLDLMRLRELPALDSNIARFAQE